MKNVGWRDSAIDVTEAAPGLDGIIRVSPFTPFFITPRPRTQTVFVIGFLLTPTLPHKTIPQ